MRCGSSEVPAHVKNNQPEPLLWKQSCWVYREGHSIVLAVLNCLTLKWQINVSNMSNQKNTKTSSETEMWHHSCVPYPDVTYSNTLGLVFQPLLSCFSGTRSDHRARGDSARMPKGLPRFMFYLPIIKTRIYNVDVMLYWQRLETTMWVHKLISNVSRNTSFPFAYIQMDIVLKWM